MDKHEKKVTDFLYTSSLLTTALAGYCLIQKDYIDSVAYINLSGGLYAIANSIKVDKMNYIKNLRLYENVTKIAAFSCLLIPDIPLESIPITISLFISGNMLLFSKVYKNERKKHQ